MVVSVPLLALGSKSTSVSAKFSFVSPGYIQYDLFSVVFFLLGLSLLILSLTLLGHGCKSTFLSPGFSECRLRQYDTICWELDLVTGFYISSWMIIWVWLDVDCVLQEAGDANSRARTRSQV